MAETFRARNEVYRNNIDMHKDVMLALFPDGVKLETAYDHYRMQIFNLIIVKLTRYAINWQEGGHQDSLEDMAVYTAMLMQIDSVENDLPF